MKYKMTDETMVVCGITLHRIQALEDNGNIKTGDLLGWIEKEENLSQEGRCVVRDNAKVWGGASVLGDSEVLGNARVLGDAAVYGNARVLSNATVYGNASVSGDAEVYGNARVLGDAAVYGDARVLGNATVYGNASVLGDSEVLGNARVSGDAVVRGNARVCDSNDFMWVSNIGSRDDTTTFFKNKHGGISVSCGCFSSTLEEFETAVTETHGSNHYAEEYELAIQLAKLHIKRSEIK